MLVSAIPGRDLGAIVMNRHGHLAVILVVITSLSLHLFVQDLLKDANCQYQIQRKAKSVMKVCPDDGGMDDVEAERIILLAGT